ncbi:MAG: winged helix-turn-helix domain-containing protein [Spongiibacteraceae bacterium]|nr:winged helix-turn-helix domain-containing protein [Spongiibacteraceae bacterium]|tara:strand:+ start:35188 stop:36342 length:1155 start_codon:yes stop_codon:yes gene_type:complete
MDYASLRPYCETQNQREALEAVISEGSQNKAAKVLGKHSRSVERSIDCIRRNASRRGFAPGHWTHGTASGFTLGKVTVQRGPDGEIQRSWDRQTPEGRAADTIIQCLENLQYKPAPVIKAPKKTTKDLLSLYTLTDFHLGMYSWSEETGDDWDTDIASKVLINAISEMARKAPDSETAILNMQGDFLHWDGLDAITPTSHHVLDADTRFERMIELALDLTMQAIEILLRKHKQVLLIVCEGNHDLAGSAWLRKAMKKLYAQNKRVTVDDTAFPYYAYLHGKTMLGFHHGHKKKNKDLPALFSSEPRYREMWGQASYTYIHTGHYHHAEQDMAEQGGAIVERHPTLAARDAYAARGGYISRRGARVITYHTEDGEIDRYTVLPRQ